jgi:hypothetical protein
MSNPRKNLIALFLAILLLAILLLVLPPHGCTEPTAKFPPTAEGCWNWETILTASWTVTEVRQDSRVGCLWIFAKCGDPQPSITHALVVLAPGIEVPIMYNYLENGVLRFMIYAESNGGEYVPDHKIDQAFYDAVVRLYKLVFGVIISNRTNL